MPSGLIRFFRGGQRGGRGGGRAETRALLPHWSASCVFRSCCLFCALYGYCGPRISRSNHPFTTSRPVPMKMNQYGFVMASLAVGASAFLLPAGRPVGQGPAFCAARRVSGARAVTKMAISQDELKKQVGYKAVDDYVQSGMVVGLGTGSTAAFAVERLGQKLKAGELKDIVAIPTSIRTKEQAESLGIPLVTLDTHSVLDVAIDGADEVDPDLNLVKGRGGALLREKMVEVCAKKFIVIVDDSKLVKGLGITGAMPVEITPFCHEHTQRTILNLPSIAGATAKLRMDGGKPYVTDNDNYIVDLYFTEPIKDSKKAGEEISKVVGVVEHGLFLDMTTAVIIAGKDGISVQKK